MQLIIGRRAKSLFLSVGVILGFASMAFGKVSIQKGAVSTVYDISVDGVDWKDLTLDQKGFVKPLLRGVDGYEGVLYKEGAPAIPAVRFYVEGNVKVTVGEPSGEKIFSSKLLVPNQPSVAKKPGAQIVFKMDQAAYQSSELYPAQPYEITPAGSVRGVQRNLVSLYPLAYNAVSKEFQFRGAFHVEASNVSAPKESAADIFAFVVGPSFINSASLLSYASMKRDLGYDVRFIKVGTDASTPDEIRAKLQALFRTSHGALKYAVVIGDAEEVPAHASNVISGVTDHYYRAIDTNNYADDINGPDIGVGRISVKTEAQLATVLEKYKKYQVGQFATEGWLSKAAFLATDDRYEIAEGSHNYVIQKYTNPKGYHGQFPVADNAGGDQLFAITNHATTADVVSAARAGRTIIDYSGHGATTFWAGPEVTQSDVRSFQHDSSIPFVISNACVTGDYRVDESFAETWQRSPTGAIVFWGSMDSTYWDEDDILERATFDAIYRDGVLNFNQLTNYGLSENWKHYGGQGKSAYYWETYHVFGDPSVLLRTEPTKAVTIDGPSVLPLGVSQSSFAVSDASGRPLAGVRVGIVREDGAFYSAGTTDSSGAVSFNIASVSNVAAAFKVSVYGPNTRLVAKEMKLIPSNEPYLSFANVTANGGGLSAVHVGEVVKLGFEIKNLGMQGTSGGNIQASLRSGPAQLMTSALRIPAIAANASAQMRGGEISFKIDPAAASADRVVVDLNWTTSEGANGTATVSLQVVRAGLAVTALDFGTVGQPDEGGIRPGDSGSVYLTIQNTGTEAIAGGMLQVVGAGCATSVQGDVAVNALAPGQSVRLAQPVNVSTASSCSNGQGASLTLAGDYQSAAMKPELKAAVSFKVGVMNTQRVSQTAIGMAIPDNAPGIEKVIDFANRGVINQIGVRVKITHTYIGDLTVELVHPDGTRVLLHDKAGGSTDNISRTYGFGGDALPALATLVGKPSEGAWKLAVKDGAPTDTGTLEEVELVIRGYLN